MTDMTMKKTLPLLVVLVLMHTACTDTPQQTTPANTPCHVHRTPFLYTLCSFEARPERFALHWQNPVTHQPFYRFETLHAHRPFVFGMNAGMYDKDFAPIGYTVMDSQTIKPLNLKDGQGNFHLMPNGVFWWDDTTFHINKSQAMVDILASGTTPKYATQSGPMLVIHGQIHPAFDPHGTSLKLRNGVGVDCADGQIHFIISDEPVNFYGFADVFKSNLGCQNALFLDGGIASALYAKNLNRHDTLNMAVMITAH